MKKLFIISLIILGVIFLSSCTGKASLHIQKVGMLVEGSIQDNLWNQKGHQGLLSIGEKYDVNVYYKEGIQTKNEIIYAVDQLVQDGVNLIFGHSHDYGRFFVEMSQNYPQVHFVYFNGGYYSDNVTSLNLNSYAMGFFGGMIAGKMTKSNQVGLIAAYEWQPEIEGYYEGAKYQNSEVKVHINSIDDWDRRERALSVYEKMKDMDVDVVYPTGDLFSLDVIKQASKDGIYALGYVSDQSDIDQSSVLTSTVQHVDILYSIAAEKFNEQSLKGGLLTFDFQDGAVTLGEFSPDVPKPFQNIIRQLVDEYRESNLLPHEQPKNEL